MNARLPAVTLGTPGVYQGIENADYHRAPGLSNSGLTKLAKSGFEYWAHYINPKRPPREVKGGQNEGTWAHCAILEPDEFDKRYVVAPDVAKNTKEWKEFIACHPNQEPIKQAQYDVAMWQAESVRALPEIAEALQNGIAEQSAWWIDEETGVLCKCRPDWTNTVSDDAVIILDVKTCGDAGVRDFSRQIAQKGYHRQDAFYTDGFAKASGQKVLAFVFVAVESTYPYSASAVMLDDPSKEQGRREVRRLLKFYDECKKSDKWPGLSQSIQLASLPPYAFDKPEYDK